MNIQRVNASASGCRAFRGGRIATSSSCENLHVRGFMQNGETGAIKWETICMLTGRPLKKKAVFGAGSFFLYQPQGIGIQYGLSGLAFMLFGLGLMISCAGRWRIRARQSHFGAPFGKILERNDPKPGHDGAIV